MEYLRRHSSPSPFVQPAARFERVNSRCLVNGPDWSFLHLTDLVAIGRLLGIYVNFGVPGVKIRSFLVVPGVATTLPALSDW